MQGRLLIYVVFKPGQNFCRFCTS